MSYTMIKSTFHKTFVIRSLYDHEVFGFLHLARLFCNGLKSVFSRFRFNPIVNKVEIDTGTCCFSLKRIP